MATQKEKNQPISKDAATGQVRSGSASKSDADQEKRDQVQKDLSVATVALSKLTSVQISNSKKDNTIRGALKEDLSGLKEFKKFLRIPGMKTAGAITRAINPLSKQRRDAKTIKKGEKAFMESMGITPKMLKERQKLVKTEKARSIALQNESKLMQEKLGLDESEIDLLRKQRDVADAQKGDANVKDDGLLKRDVKTGKFVKNQDKKLSDMSSAMMGGKGLGKGGKDEGAEATEEKREAIAETEQRNDILEQIEENTRDLGKEKKVDKKSGLLALLGKLISGIGSAVTAALGGLGGIIGTAVTAAIAGLGLRSLMGSKPTVPPKISDADKAKMTKLQNAAKAAKLEFDKKVKAFKTQVTDLEAENKKVTNDANRRVRESAKNVKALDNKLVNQKIVFEKQLKILEANKAAVASETDAKVRKEMQGKIDAKQVELDAKQADLEAERKKVDAQRKLAKEVDAKTNAAREAAVRENNKKIAELQDEIKRVKAEAVVEKAKVKAALKVPPTVPPVDGAGVKPPIDDLAGTSKIAKLAKIGKFIPVVGTAALTIFDAIMGIINRQSNLRGTGFNEDSVMGIMMGAGSGVLEGLTFGALTARDIFTMTGIAAKDPMDFMLKIKNKKESLANTQKKYAATRGRMMKNYNKARNPFGGGVGTDEFKKRVDQRMKLQPELTRQEAEDKLFQSGRMNTGTLSKLTRDMTNKKGKLDEAKDEARVFTKKLFEKMTPIEMDAYLKKINTATGNNLTAANIVAAIADATAKAAQGNNNSGAASPAAVTPGATDSAISNGTPGVMDKHK